ncbi:MAG TPA: Calx-beta domain-containing protein [Pyrinomonadaceae bacterium]|jgi:hypothetical protein
MNKFFAAIDVRPRILVLAGLACALSFVFLFRAASAESADVPATTAAVTAPTASVRILPLPAGDLVYDANTQKLYASIPSTPRSIKSIDPNTQQVVNAENNIGPRRNSITSIDPYTLSLGESWYVGSEPKELVLSDGGRYLYTNLAGSRTIQRIDLSTRTVEPPFWLGEQSYLDENNPINGALLKALNMVALPGEPESLAVALEDGLAVYDNGVRRPEVTTYGSLRRAVTAASADTLYASNYIGDFSIFSVNDVGVRTVKTIRSFDLLKSYVHELKYSNGLIYASNGKVIDPTGTPRVVGELFTNNPGFEPLALILPEPSLNLVYYLIPRHGIIDDKYGDAGTVTVRVYNTQTYALVGSFDIPNVLGQIKGFTRWGGNGLAFCAGNETYIIRTSLIPSADPVDLPVPQPSATPTPPPVFPKNVRELSLPNNDIVYDSRRGVIYASVPAYAASYGNSVAAVDPKTGAVVSAINVGPDPGKLALSRDGHYLYVALNGAQAVRRVDLDLQRPDLQFAIAPVQQTFPPFGQFPQPIFAIDMEVLPESPQSVVVARMHIQGPYTLFAGAGIYDNGVLRRTASHGAMESFSFYDADTVYGTADRSGSVEVTVTPLGAATKPLAGGLFQKDFKIDRGLAFNPSGWVIDPQRVRIVGENIIPTLTTFPQFPQVEPDVAAGRAYYLTGLDAVNGSATIWKIHSFDLSNNWLLGTLEIPGVKGVASPLIRCGAGCLAFGTDRDQVFVVESSLVASATPPPTPTPTPAPRTYTLTGRATDQSGQALGDVTIIISGSMTGTQQVKTDSEGNYAFTYSPDTRYQITPAKSGYTFEPKSTTFASHTFVTGDKTANFSGSPGAALPTISVSYGDFIPYEEQGKVVITVTRSGDISGGAALDYQTIDDMSPVRCDAATGIAYSRCDYISAAGTLLFSAGESKRSFTVLVIDDAHTEGLEVFYYKLTNPVGLSIPSPATYQASIRDNTVIAGGSNPIYRTHPFVRQQYLDFLAREPEAEGFRAWRDVLDSCSDVNNNPLCDRVTVSSAFFRSHEFQLKGYFVYRYYRASFGRLPHYGEIISDMLSVTAQTPDEVAHKRDAFAEAWVERAEFKTLYPATLTEAQFVDKLLQTLNVTLAGDVTRESLIADMQANRKNRAGVLRAIVEHPDVDKKEYNGAFVAMQYFGYLRRDPEPEGYQAWLKYLNEHPSDYRTMVHGFVNSVEYRLRFGQP